MTENHNEYKALICDFDMTLIDSKQDIANGLAWCFSNINKEETTVDKILPFIGQGLQTMFNQFSPGIKVGSPEFFTHLKKFQAYYKEHCDIHTTIYPGVLQTLKTLKDQGIRLAIATNKHGHIATHVATKLGIVDLFEHIQGTEVLRGKPDPGLLLATFKALNLNPSEIVSVGDRASDIVASKKAGCISVAVTYGVDDRATLKKEKPAFVFDRFDELLQLF